MEQVVARGNVRAALARVRENRGSPGVDGLTVDELPQYLMEHWPEVREQLLGGTYQPRPVLRREIPKRDGGVRELGIPCVLDRLIGSVRNFVCEQLVVNGCCMKQQSPTATA
jgi:RNA-directed DNA polymerase